MKLLISLISMAALNCSPVLATCSTASVGEVCQPLVTNISNPAITTIKISWLPGEGIPPQSVKLVQGGTVQKGFLDGKILGTASETSSLGQYADYSFTLSGQPAGTTVSNLHIVGIWGSSSLPSNEFAASTSPSAPTGTTPSITSAQFDNWSIAISWTSPKQYDFYNVRWSSGTLVAANAPQAKVEGFSFSTPAPVPGPYAFIVEGCVSNVFGILSSTCSSWSKTVTATVPQPTVPVTSKSLNLSTDHKGDCTLQNITITFFSNGTLQFNAQVKTDHTHSGDYWNMNFNAVNSSGTVVAGEFKWRSMRMDDDHGFYNWSFTDTYDARVYSQITGGRSTNSC